MRTNCENCGAILQNGICAYCGTDYREPIQFTSIGKIHCDSERLTMKYRLDPFHAIEMDADCLMAHIKSDMVQKFAKELANHIKYKTYTDPQTDELVICSFVDVAKKGSYWID